MKICPRCGASEKEKRFIGQFCVDCFLKENPDLVKFRDLEIHVCVHCGRIKLFGKWKEAREDELRKFLEKKMKTKLEDPSLDILDLDVTRNNILVLAKICGKIKGERICIEKELKVRLKKTQCPVCSKVKGDYWEAKIQLRGEKSTIEKALIEARKMVNSIAKRDKRAMVWRTEARKEGIDIFLGAKRIAKEVVKRLKNKFGAKVKETYKLTGEDVHKGKRKYKVTYSVRLNEQ